MQQGHYKKAHLFVKEKHYFPPENAGLVAIFTHLEKPVVTLHRPFLLEKKNLSQSSMFVVMQFCYNGHGIHVAWNWIVNVSSAPTNQFSPQISCLFNYIIVIPLLSSNFRISDVRSEHGYSNYLQAKITKSKLRKLVHADGSFP